MYKIIINKSPIKYILLVQKIKNIIINNYNYLYKMNGNIFIKINNKIFI